MSPTEKDQVLIDHGLEMIWLKIWHKEMTFEWFQEYQKQHNQILPALSKDPGYICVCDWCLKNSDRSRREMLTRINIENITHGFIQKANEKEKDHGKS